MKTWKKVLAVLLACLFVFASVQVIASAEDEEQPQEIVLEEDAVLAEDAPQDAEDAEQVNAAVEAPKPDKNPLGGLFDVLGRVLGGILCSPLLVVDFVVWLLSGFRVHIFHPDWLFG